MEHERRDEADTAKEKEVRKPENERKQKKSDKREIEEDERYNRENENMGNRKKHIHEVEPLLRKKTETDTGLQCYAACVR